MKETLKAVKEIMAYAESVDARTEALVALMIERKPITRQSFTDKLGEIGGGKTNKWNELYRLLATAVEKDQRHGMSPLDEQLNKTI